jgi:hypothetical protein
MELHFKSNKTGGLLLRYWPDKMHKNSHFDWKMLENGDFGSFERAISHQQGKLFTQVKIVINTKFYSLSRGVLEIGLSIQLEILKICCHYFLIQNQISTLSSLTYTGIVVL